MSRGKAGEAKVTESVTPRGGHETEDIEWRNPGVHGNGATGEETLCET